MARKEIYDASKLRCCRYLRKSRDDSKSETLEETLERHAKITKAMADDAGLEIQETYQEVVSGSSISERPQMKRLLQDLKALKWDMVVVVDISRLSRGDGSDQTVICNAFKLTDTRCLSDWRTYDLSKRDDLELFEKKLQSSRDEYRAITRRLRGGVMETIKEGYSCGGCAPYGLARAGDRRKMVYVPGENFENLKMILDYPHKSAEPTWGGLRRMLHDLGIRSPRGHEWWCKESLKKMFKTPAYFGEVEYGRRPTESELGEHFEEVKKRVINDAPFQTKARWEPFFDKTYADAGFAILSGTSTNYRARKPSNPLRGLLVCGKCGRGMVHSSVNKKTKARYFVHNGYSMGQGKCWCRQISTTRLYAALINALEADAADLDAHLADTASPSPYEAASRRLESLKKRKASIDSSKLSAYDRLERRIIDEALYSSISAKISEAEKSVNAQIAQAEKDIHELASPETCQRKLVNAKKAIRILESGDLEPEQVNKALKLIVDKIEYFNETEKWTKDKGARLVVHLRS